MNCSIGSSSLLLVGVGVGVTVPELSNLILAVVLVSGSSHVRSVVRDSQWDTRSVMEGGNTDWGDSTKSRNSVWGDTTDGGDSERSMPEAADGRDTAVQRQRSQKTWRKDVW